MQPPLRPHVDQQEKSASRDQDQDTAPHLVAQGLEEYIPDVAVPRVAEEKVDAVGRKSVRDSISVQFSGISLLLGVQHRRVLDVGLPVHHKAHGTHGEVCGATRHLTHHSAPAAVLHQLAPLVREADGQAARREID